jgi:hypothetical protein
LHVVFWYLGKTRGHKVKDVGVKDELQGTGRDAGLLEDKSELLMLKL